MELKSAALCTAFVVRENWRMSIFSALGVFKRTPFWTAFNSGQSNFTSFSSLVVMFMFFTISSIHSSVTWAQAACSSSASPSCEVYAGCIEANCNCAAGDSPYSGTFGPKYCGRFIANNNFSSDGKAWRDKTLLCLADEISKSYVANIGPPCNCKQIQKDAIASHNKCYTLAPSFCKLSDDDVREVARIVDIKDIFILGARGVKEVAKTLATCMINEGIDKGTQTTIVFADETLVEGGEEARHYLLDVLAAGAAYGIEKGKQEVKKAFDELKKKYAPTIPPPG
jgi:hypothetical protein